MRNFIAILVWLATGLVLTGTVLQFDIAERDSFAKLPGKHGITFTVPEVVNSIKPEEFLQVCSDISRDQQLNIFRVSQGYNRDEQPTVEVFGLFSKPTQMFTGIEILDGNLPGGDTPKFDLRTRQYGGERTGTLRDFLNNDRLRFADLGQAFDILPIQGTYYFEARDQDLKKIQRIFSEHLNKSFGLSTAPSDFNPPRAPTNLTSGYLGLMFYAAAALVTLILTISVAYLQMNSSKQTGVLRLHGWSSVAIWFHSVGTTIFFSWCTVVIAAALVVALLPNTNTEVFRRVFLSCIFILVSMTISSLIAITFILNRSIAEYLKNRKDTRALYIGSLVTKYVATVFLVFIISAILTGMQNFLKQPQLSATWSKASDYAVFPQDKVGMNTNDPQFLRFSFNISDELLTKMENSGALVVATGGIKNGNNSFIVVNPNFLQRFPVEDVNSTKVTVSDTESDVVLLVPPQQMDQVSSLRNTAANNFARPDRHSSEVAVRVIPIAAQKVFAFDPDLGASTESYVDSPVMAVATQGNRSSLLLTGLTGQGLASALKVPLLEGSAEKAYQHWLPELKKNHRDQNLPYLTGISDAVKQRAAAARDNLMVNIGFASALILTMLVLSFQSIGISVERFVHKSTIRGLHGYPPIARYKEILLWVGIVGCAQLLTTVALGSVKYNPFESFGGGKVPLGSVLVTSVLVLGCEIIGTLGILALISRRRMALLLKGEV